MATTDTQLFDISTNKATDKYKNQLQKKKKMTTQGTMIISEPDLLKRLYQFRHRNQINPSILSCITIICYLKAL